MCEEYEPEVEFLYDEDDFIVGVVVDGEEYEEGDGFEDIFDEDDEDWDDDEE